MNNDNHHISVLCSQICSALTPLVDADYVYLDLPYHANIGDAMIWMGTESWLCSLPFRCLLRASYSTFSFPKLKSEVIILMHGGGNFGDLWRQHQEFRLKVIQHYPNNRIIILPQTVYYSNPKFARHDAAIVRQYPNIIVCARDQRSFRFLKAFRFAKHVLLLPDMAFCADIKPIHNTKEAILIKRTDKEWNESLADSLPAGIDVCDWCSIDKPDEIIKNLGSIQSPKEIDSYAFNVFLPHLIELGVRQLGSYKTIHTTRLHAAILGILLGKEVVLYDNSYGKNRAFYDTWLCDIPSVKLATRCSNSSFRRSASLGKNWLLTQKDYFLHA